MRKGFTLIELLAVIIVLAIVALIATPIVLNVVEDAKKSAAESEANLILKGLNSYCQNEDFKIQMGTLTEENRKCNHNITYYINQIIPNKSDDTTITNVKYENGKITDLTVESNDYIYILDSSTNQLEELTDGYVGANPCTTGSDELWPGDTYTNGKYTYRYMLEAGSDSSWHNISEEGWGVMLTDKDSTSPVTTKLCSSINNKPIVSMKAMFANSQASSIDLSSFDTSNVTDMLGMFSYSQASSIDVSSFDTSKVTDMSQMFARSQATQITGLTNFNTSNVTSMTAMFDVAKADELDLSSFDISNVIHMDFMFAGAAATRIYAKNQVTVNRFLHEGSAPVIVSVK